MASVLVFLFFCQILPFCLNVDYSLLESYRPKPTQRLEVIKSILNVPLERLYLATDSVEKSTFEPKLTENCTQAFENFSDALLNFSRCSLANARPIQICMKCQNEHQNAEKNYKTFRNQGSECQEFFFSSDQLEIVEITYNSAMQLWTKSVCKNCYDHLNDTNEFFANYQDLQTCIQSSNQTAVLSKNGTCDECSNVYGNLSSIYKKFVSHKKDFESGICMDIVDAMNISRKIWTDFKCTVPFETKIGFLNVITAITVGATPLMFYLLAKNISRLEDIKLVRPKRKSTAVPPVSNPQ